MDSLDRLRRWKDANPSRAGQGPRIGIKGQESRGAGKFGGSNDGGVKRPYGCFPAMLGELVSA